MAPIFFTNTGEFRKWLEANHQTESELIVGYYKVGTKKPSMTWSDSVDEALCFGWIDGIRRSVDDEAYCIRFTPRNPKSNWSAVNIAKVEELIRLRKMTSAGLAAFEKRSVARSEIYSYENRPEKFTAEMEARFRENSEAWSHFDVQSPSYKKTIIYWVMSAKQEATRNSRLEKLIAACSEGKRLR
ncbi:MAG: bacteriocin-protection protein [Bacteroidetes bacterium GWB2_41_8]|nr:MAG: bacteriocin-protection protein [Bacteroidetes bacterium GWB2_41_8]